MLRTGRALWVICAVALCLRLACVAWVAVHDTWRFTERDSASYLEPAWALLDTGRFDTPDNPMVIRTPGYPLFLAAAMEVAGHWNKTRLVAVQALVSMLTLAAAYAMAARLAGRRAGLLAAAWVAVDLSLFYASLVILTEWLAALLAAVAGVAALRWLDGRKHRDAAGLGLALAALTLVRPIAYFLPLPMAALACGLRPGRARLVAATLVLLPSLVLVGGWQARNHALTGSWEYSWIQGWNLMGYRAAPVLAQAEGIGLEAAKARLMAQAGPEGTAAERYGRMKAVALATLKAHPAAAAALQLKGTLVTLLDPGDAPVIRLLSGDASLAGRLNALSGQGLSGFLAQWGGEHPFMLASLAAAAALLLALYLAAAMGCARLWRDGRRAGLAVVLGLAAYFIVLSGGLEANSRFRAPAAPLLAVLAGIGTAALVERRRPRYPAAP